jgi:tRNA/rRNA methyltransferase
LDTEIAEKVVHSSCEWMRERTHAVLVRPEYGGNVGSAARALANMGIQSPLRIVGTSSVLDASSWRMAKHARHRLENALYFSSLFDAAKLGERGEAYQPLLLATTARAGSANRPHPLRVDVAVHRALGKLERKEVTDLFLVFGTESDGLCNEDIGLCDWIVTIPSSDEYPSLNLSQAVLLLSYEVNRAMTSEAQEFRSQSMSQRDRLIAHFLGLAEASGFVLPGDPHKMRPRLEEILSQLPPYVKDVSTLHGLLGQAIRSLKASGPEYKGRYRHLVETRPNIKEVP